MTLVRGTLSPDLHTATGVLSWEATLNLWATRDSFFCPPSCVGIIFHSTANLCLFTLNSFCSKHSIVCKVFHNVGPTLNWINRQAGLDCIVGNKKSNMKTQLCSNTISGPNQHISLKLQIVSIIKFLNALCSLQNRTLPWNINLQDVDHNLLSLIALKEIYLGKCLRENLGPCSSKPQKVNNLLSDKDVPVG